MSTLHNPLPPDYDWVDLLAVITMILLVFVIIYAIIDGVQQTRLLNQAYNTVDSTFAATWDGNRQLEFYAWTVTVAKLAGHPNRHVRTALYDRLQQAQYRWRPMRPQRKKITPKKPTI